MVDAADYFKGNAAGPRNQILRFIRSEVVWNRWV